MPAKLAPDLADANPLTGPILALLRAHPQGISEYQVIQQLGDAWPTLASDPTVLLFQKHFLVMNALYRLQLRLWGEEGVYLSISPLLVRLEPATGADGQAVVESTEQPLRDYYLDWSQFVDTDRAAVDALLAGFWQRFHAGGAVEEALAELGLALESDWGQVRHRYRQLAAASHPDRGGDPARFLAVRGAYEQLRLHFHGR